MVKVLSSRNGCSASSARYPTHIKSVQYTIKLDQPSSNPRKVHGIARKHWSTAGSHRHLLYQAVLLCLLTWSVAGSACLPISLDAMAIERLSVQLWLFQHLWKMLPFGVGVPGVGFSFPQSEARISGSYLRYRTAWYACSKVSLAPYQYQHFALAQLLYGRLPLTALVRRSWNIAIFLRLLYAPCQ